MTAPRLLSERYELGEVLGYGSISEVHRATDTVLGRNVAIKVLRADLAHHQQAQERFRREVRSAVQLDHPAIVAIYDKDSSAAAPYVAMEYAGRTLREVVQSTGPMTQQKVVEVMADVCAALEFAHSHDVVHQAIKPTRIMINSRGAVKVRGFGIAHDLSDEDLDAARYLSPEQADGGGADARSDVYAAGCVLYELLTGEPPFTGDTPLEVSNRRLRADLRAPSQVNPAVPAALEAVVLRAMPTLQAGRYQSASAMRDDLVQVRQGLVQRFTSDTEGAAPPLAQPVGSVPPFRRPAAPRPRRLPPSTKPPVEPGQRRVFVSYRTRDTGAAAGWLADSLISRFGQDRVFFDVESIDAGADFRAAITQAIDQTAVMLVLIGDRWSTEADRSGQRRLDDPDDVMRVEVAQALRARITVIPVLYGEAEMPRARELPADLAGLTSLSALALGARTFRRDVHDVLDRVARLLHLP